MVSVAGVSGSISGINSSGRQIPLDSAGNLRLVANDRIPLNFSGLTPGPSVELWMFSTPIQLGQAKADASGNLSTTVVVPTALESGNHRIVIKAMNEAGKSVTLSVGIVVGAQKKLSSTTRLLIITPVSLAILAALIIPATRRRRRSR
jgi:hypothetical protein